jgi:hypothetical protein
MKLVVRLLTEGFVWVRTYDDLPQDAEGHLSKLVHLRTGQKPISDARTATYVILSTGSGPGGRWFKSNRPDQLFCNQRLTQIRIVEERLVGGQEVDGSNPFAPTILPMSRVAHSPSHIDLHRNCFLLFNAQNLSRLVNQRLLFIGRKTKTKTHVDSALSPPLDVVEQLLAVAT